MNNDDAIGPDPHPIKHFTMIFKFPYGSLNNLGFRTAKLCKLTGVRGKSMTIFFRQFSSAGK